MRAKRSGMLVGLALFLGTSARGASPVLPWVEDDYAQALAEARSREVPLFIDVWAPW